MFLQNLQFWFSSVNDGMVAEKGWKHFDSLCHTAGQMVQWPMIETEINFIHIQPMQSYSTMAPPISHIAFPASLASVWKICRLQDFHCASLRNLGVSLEHLKVADTNCLLKLLETIQLEHKSSQNDTRYNVARTNCINPPIICKHMLQHVLPFSILSTTCKGYFGWNSFAFAFKFQSPAEAL